MWEKNILDGISNNAVRQREARALRNIRRITNLNKDVLVQGEDIQEINKEFEKINKEEKDIYSLEKLWMLFNENDGNNIVNLEELGIHMSEEMQRILDIENASEVDLNDTKLMKEYYIQDMLDKYYANLSDTIQKKEILEQRKERHEEFMAIYEPAEREYLNNEDIFDPDYTIKGVKIKKIKEIKDVTKKKSIADLISNTSALVYLHHSGINTIQDLLSKAENIEKIKEYLNSIKGLDEIDKEMITENIINNNYFNEEKLNNDEEVDSKLSTDVWKLNLSIQAYNCLKRAGINTVGDLADITEERLRSVRNLGKSKFEEIVTKMQEYGIYFKTEEEVEKERIEQHEKRQQEYREANEKSWQEYREARKKEETNRPKTDLEIALHRRFRELFGEDEEQPLEDISPEQLQGQIKINEGIIAKNEEKIKEALVDVSIAEQKKIKSQEAELSDLKSQRRDIDE